MAPAGDSYDWFEDTAVEQLRQDQCLMSEVLRLGGPAMATVAQDGLNQPQDKLHALANRQHWENTPLAQAYENDRDAASRELDALHALRGGWSKPLVGLETPGGINDSDFHWPPGSPGDSKEDFYSQTGLSKWISDRFWKSESDFYEDPTPKADAATLKAVDDLGTPSTARNLIRTCLSGIVSWPSRARSSGCTDSRWSRRGRTTPVSSSPPAASPAPPRSRARRSTASRSRT